MDLEAAFSVAMLGAFIWALRFRLPRALQTQDRLAVTSAILTAVLALVGWLLIGIRVRALL
jgi:hypothetical protein